MAKINSVLGEIDTKDLGFTLMHEHLLVLDWSMRAAFSEWFHAEEVLRINKIQLECAASCGVRTLVDGTAVNMGRDPILMKRASEESGINIIASTGFYHQNEFWENNKKPDQIAKLLIKDIEVGIAGTDVRAGIIKCGIDEDGLSPQIQLALRAAAKAHIETGVPVYAHTTPDEDKWMQLQAFLLEHGVRPDKLVIGHCGDEWRVPYKKEIDDCNTILKQGCLVGLDRFGNDDRNDIHRRLQCTVDLIRQGWEKQLILSHDFTGYCDWLADDWTSMKNYDRDRIEKGMYGMFKLNYISTVVIPELLKRGVTQQQVDQIFIHNPRNYFEP